MTDTNDLRPGYVYVACPYSSYDKNVRDWRARAAAAYVAFHTAKSCASMWSPVAYFHHLPDGESKREMMLDTKTWDDWGKICLPLLLHASEVRVLQLPGWETSLGTKREIEAAEAAGIPIHYVSYDGNAADFQAEALAKRSKTIPDLLPNKLGRVVGWLLWLLTAASLLSFVSMVTFFLVRLALWSYLGLVATASMIW